MSETLYKILGPNRMPCWGGSGQWHHCDWMPEVDVDPCRSGYHLCRVQDVPAWVKTGELWVVKGRGKSEITGSKVVFSEARLVKKIGGLDLVVLVRWAEDCAARADDADAACYAAYAAEAAYAAATAARYAAAYAARYAAAYADANDAAYADANDAWVAERKWQGERLLQLVSEGRTDDQN